MSDLAPVSVIVPVRNGIQTLPQTLRSILAEPEVREVIIVDDGSTDGSGDYSRGLQDDRVRVVQGPQTGISDAFNTGLAHATLPYVARCDADDLFPAGRLRRQVAWLESYPDHIAVSGAFLTIDTKGKPLVSLSDSGVTRDVTAELKAGQAVTHFCGWLTRREALVAVGGMRAWFASAEDLDIAFRLAAIGPVWHEPIVSYEYRLHDKSITHTQADRLRDFYERSAVNFATIRAEGRRDPLELGTPPALPTSDGSATGRPRTASHQAAGLLEGRAWQLHAAGARLQAVRLALRALMMEPRSVARWRGVAVIALLSPDRKNHAS